MKSSVLKQFSSTGRYSRTNYVLDVNISKLLGSCNVNKEFSDGQKNVIIKVVFFRIQGTCYSVFPLKNRNSDVYKRQLSYGATAQVGPWPPPISASNPLYPLQPSSSFLSPCLYNNYTSLKSFETVSHFLVLENSVLSLPS